MASGPGRTFQDGVLGEVDLKNPLLWAGLGIAAIGAFLLLNGGKKKLKQNRRRGYRRNKRRARRR